MPDLSVLVPARNEMFLARTIEDVLEHARADTEVIAILDGAWADPPVKHHPRVTVVYLPESIGQRAATNLAARLSSARYIAKADAHCGFDEGFDVKLIEAAQELGEDVVQIPLQYNWHAFDRICQACGFREYQGPMNIPCPKCQATGQWTREMVWKPRMSRKTTAWRFDSTLHFAYFGEFSNRPEGKGELTETMSCLGAFWFLSRKWFWELDGLDEQHGSWGQMGTELACKAWLSGGRMITNHRTWFGHMFRTQGGDFSFPYSIKGSDQERARQYSRDLWLNNRWPKQVRPLAWLVEHFAPTPDWHGAGHDALAKVKAAGEAWTAARSPNPPPVPAPAPPTPSAHATFDVRVVPSETSRAPAGPTKGIIYYSDNRPSPVILEAARRTIERSGLPIVAVTLQPIVWPGATQQIVLARERGYETMFRQILAGLEALTTDIVFFCEHDVCYDPSHFQFTPPRADTVYYNQSVWKLDATTGRALFHVVNQTSGLCAYRALMVEHYRKRLEVVAREGHNRRHGFEPGTRKIRHGGIDDLPFDVWCSTRPNVDIRHGTNLTPSRWRKDQFRNQRYTEGWCESDHVPGWGQTLGRFDAWLEEVTR